MPWEREVKWSNAKGPAAVTGPTAARVTSGCTFDHLAEPQYDECESHRTVVWGNTHVKGFVP